MSIQPNDRLDGSSEPTPPEYAEDMAIRWAHRAQDSFLNGDHDLDWNAEACVQLATMWVDVARMARASGRWGV